MTIAISNRVKQVETYYFAQKLAEIRARIASGQEIINLGIGSPDLAPPPAVIAILKKEASKNNTHGYQSYRGNIDFRKSIASWYDQYFKVNLDYNDEILPLIGSKEGIMHISMTYLQVGDSVLLPDPGYPSYAAAAKLAGATIVKYPLVASQNYQPDLNKLEAEVDLKSIKIMWINYPHMPTGAIASKDLYTRLIAFARKHQILICSDNPYAMLHDDYQSILSIKGAKENGIELMSMSKNYHMAGWRIGFLSSSKGHIENVLRFKSNMDSGMFLPIQRAASAALDGNDDWRQEILTVYEKRRNKIRDIADYLGISYDSSKKGLFVWCKIKEKDDKAYIEKLLDEAGVFIAPGSIFGDYGRAYVRFSICQSIDQIERAFQKIKMSKL